MSERDKTVTPTSIKDHSKRISSLELLRILAMIAILFCHFAAHGVFHVLQPSVEIYVFFLVSPLLFRKSISDFCCLQRD